MAVQSTIDVDTLRAQTPGCANVTHFNHAGASLMPQSVIDAVVTHTIREGDIGGYEAEDEAADPIARVYDVPAELLNADRSEIAMIENATRAWDMVFYAIPFQPGDRILTAMAEYHSNVIAFYQMRKRGVSVEVVPNDENGQIDVGALADMMDERVRLVAISHMPTNGGLVQPAEDIGRVVAKWPALYLLDACQSAGHKPLDVRAIGCHMLSASARKYLRGPRGQGFLWVDSGVVEQLEPPMLDGHAAHWSSRDRYELMPDARRFENWERSFANILGMGEAIRLANALGADAIWERIQQQATLLRSRLAEIPGVTETDIGAVQSGIVTFTMEGNEPDDIQRRLLARRINVTTSSVASTRFDMEDRGLEKVVRSSVHYLTTDDEIDHLVAALGAFR
jgi:cysteine desulfurase / selenocysteine lyase